MKKVRNIFVAALAMLTVLSMGSVANTYAKYTSDETATASATVAKWDVQFGDGEELKFNLAESILDTEAGDGSYTEEDVAEGKIAPGTKGSFKIKVTNNSEVNAYVTASLDEDTISDLPIQFTIKNSDSILLNMGESQDIEIEWIWPYEGSDDADIELAGTDIEITVKLNAVQKN